MCVCLCGIQRSVACVVSPDELFAVQLSIAVWLMWWCQALLLLVWGDVCVTAHALPSTVFALCGGWQPTLARRLCEKTSILPYLLNRISTKKFDDNTLACRWG